MADKYDVGRMLDQAFPGPVATPDYLAHDCERAERALLGAAGRHLIGADPDLLRRLALIPGDAGA